MAGAIDRLERIVNTINEKASWLAYIAIAAMMAFVFYDILARYFGHPTSGSNDVVQLLEAAAVAFAMGYTMILRRHPTAGLIVTHLPARTQGVIGTVTGFLSLVLFILLTWSSASLGERMWANHEGTMTLGIPIYPFIYCITLGSVLMCLGCLTSLLNSLRRALLGRE